jgi:hypothetical protein
MACHGSACKIPKTATYRTTTDPTVQALLEQLQQAIDAQNIPLIAQTVMQLVTMGVGQISANGVFSINGTSVDTGTGEVYGGGGDVTTPTDQTWLYVGLGLFFYLAFVR